MRDRIDCPECSDPVRIGIPRDATVDSVSSDPADAPDPASTPETVRSATPTCPTCGPFVVVCGVERGEESPSRFGAQHDG